MMSGTGKSGRAVFKSALASVLALLAFAMCAPQLAFADETTQAINGTMTITLQDGGVVVLALEYQRWAKLVQALPPVMP